MMPFLGLVLVAIFVLPFNTSAAERSYYAEAAQAFSGGYSTANKILSDNFADVRRSRRMLSLQMYIEKPKHSHNLNFDSTQETSASFARYVCAGTGTYGKERIALTNLNDYQSTLNGLSKEPPSDIVGLWKDIAAIRGLQNETPQDQPDKDNLTLINKDSANAENCQKQVLASIKEPMGVALEPGGDEIIFDPMAIYSVIKSVYAALKAAAIGALKITDDAQRAAALGKFIKSHSAQVNNLLSDEYISDASLDSLYDLRKKAALVAPLAEFRRLNPQLPDQEKVHIGLRVHDLLKDYDILQDSATPREIKSAMVKAQKRLETMANEGVTASDIWSYLMAFSKVMDEAMTSGSDIEGKIVKLVNQNPTK
jgi:hypothetical protein